LSKKKLKVKTSANKSPFLQGQLLLKLGGGVLLNFQKCFEKAKELMKSNIIY
jgi:hypothetical protein